MMNLSGRSVLQMAVGLALIAATQIPLPPLKVR